MKNGQGCSASLGGLANTALDRQEQQQRLMHHLSGFQVTWIIDIGLKSGLLRAIADAKGADEKTLAQRLGFSGVTSSSGAVPPTR